MNRSKFFFVALVGFLGFQLLRSVGADFPKDSPKFLTDYAEAIAAGKKENKPVILVFSASWCGPCQTMKKKVYPDPVVQKLHGDFIWAYLDTDIDANSKAAAKYKVSGIPHIEIVKADETSVGQQIGSSTPSDFATVLTAAKKKAAGK
jgi:thioredoxin 1